MTSGSGSFAEHANDWRGCGDTTRSSCLRSPRRSELFGGTARPCRAGCGGTRFRSAAARPLREWLLPRCLGQRMGAARCDTLVFVYPTWWSGQPAVLKGWIDRVLANGVAWNLDEPSGHAMPALRNITRIVAITTHGRSRTVNLICGRAGRVTIMRNVRRLCSWRCRARWVALHSLDRSTRFERDRFMQRVERLLRRIV